MIMDHAQGRAFHHHLARAIMHLNHLAGLLPFFEPPIEWDDPMPDQQFRLGRPNHASRSLHTFVPFPSASNPPMIVSHGGIPSHMIVNPEPGVLLQWNCWSHSCKPPRLDQQLGAIYPTSQLLASSLQHP